MHSSKVVVPETVRLALADEEWIRVKKRLNAGEMIELFQRSTNPNDASKPDPTLAPMALVLAYLVDWSFVDPQGEPIVLIDQTAEARQAALWSLDFDTYTDIIAAVRDHDQTQRREKKRPSGGATTSFETSPSPVDSVGAMSGS